MRVLRVWLSSDRETLTFAVLNPSESGQSLKLANEGRL